jgi:Holliday junction resolvase RusA-like endonuclease
VRHADAMMMGKMPKPVHGHFNIAIVLDETQRVGDADNRVKCVLDWLQRVELIDNDKLADHVAVYWGEAPHERCTVTVIGVDDADQG